MKNIFSTNDEKISEKAFSQSLLISVVSILICIVALCSATYAWFSGDVQSNTNNIKAGHFSVNVVSVIRTDDETSNASENTILPNTSGVYTLESGTYTITLRPTDETTVKGHCVITINGNEYRTDVIVNENTVSESYPTANSPFVFQIKLSEESTIEIESKWGIPTDPVIVKGTTIDTTVLSSISDEATAEQ